MNYKNQIVDGQMCIWLQSYGFAPAKKVSEFNVGEKMLWNFGSKSEIVGFGKETAKTIMVKSLCSNGATYEHRMKKDRYVAIG